MHSWGDKDKQGRDICARVEDVALYIGDWLRRYGRINVMERKVWNCTSVYRLWMDRFRFYHSFRILLQT